MKFLKFNFQKTIDFSQLVAILEHGLRVETTDGVLVSHPRASSRSSDLGQHDIVIVAVKAPALPAIAKQIASLLHRSSLVVFVLNGVPWWYFRAHGGPLDGTRLPRLDPHGALWEHIPADRIVGAVAYTAGTVVAPGVFRAENARNRLIVGRPDGRPDDRLDAFAALLDPTGVDVTVTPTIRDAIWSKLTNNLIGGSLAVLTASATKDVFDKPTLAHAATVMADEAAAVARALGCDPGDPAAALSKLATSSHRQSILQDLTAGRGMEIDALFRVPLDLAALAQVHTPTLDLMIELATQRARANGLYHDAVE